MTRQQKRETVRTWGCYDFDGKLAQFISELQNLVAAHPDKVIELDSEYETEYGGDRVFRLTAYYRRDETDAEVEAREAEDTMRKQHRRQMFEQLKKEFGE